LLRVVLDSELRLPMDSQLVRTAAGDVLTICGESADAGRAEVLGDAGVEVVRVGLRNERLDLAAVLDVLGERKILSLLLECGRELNGAFLRADLVDRVVVFSSAMVLGVGGVEFAAGMGPVMALEERLVGVARDRFGEDERVSGYLRDPWSALG
jgi:diaminohydroxyphosphoribosylaminopyrimidine deaminase/5-amino-6-(5-phosphoribosylamino)uracil reductase